jgi:hypothetical protein
MTALTPLILPALIGFLALSVLLKKSKLPNKPVFILFIAPCLGLAVCSLFIFWCYVIYPSGAKRLSQASIAILGVVFLLMYFYQLYRKLSYSKFSFREKFYSVLNFFKAFRFPSKFGFLKQLATLALLAGLLYIVFQYIIYYGNTTYWNVWGGWDARYFWNLKAKFFFRDPTAWQNMFSPVLAWSHPDYPLLLPGVVAWGWICMGKEMLIWPAIVGLLFSLTIIFLIIWYLMFYVSKWSALIASSFLLIVETYRFWSTTQYADAPFCLWITLATVLLTLAFRLREKTLLFAAGFFSGLSAWTKNEGILFIFYLTALFLIMLFCSTEFKKNRRLAAIAFLGGLLIPLLATIYLKTFLYTSGDYLGTNRGLSELLHRLFNRSNSAFIAQCFLVFPAAQTQWAGLWFFFALAILINWKSWLRNWRWVTLAPILTMQFGYFVIIHLTPMELKAQVETALLRLMFHTTALALLFTVESFNLTLLPEIKNR